MNDKKVFYPREVILEVTNLCNLRCRFCHFHGDQAEKKRKLGVMDNIVWETVLDEISQWGEPCSVLTHGAGEPLLYPSLEALLVRAGGLSNVKTGFMTNGMLLTEDISKMLVELQVDNLALSIDGVIPETHDYFRQNADLKRIEQNVRFLIKEKEKAGSDLPGLFFNMVGYPAILDQTDAYVKKWLPHADTVMVSKFRPVGSRKLWGASESHPFLKCPLLYNQAVISIEGDVGLCCEDINLDVPLGNVREEGLLSIFNNSRAINDYRRHHEQGCIDSLKLCSDCHVWAGGMVLDTRERKIKGLSVNEIVSPAGQIFKKP